ncbi:MAG: T9SS type A sorting domain-containing protein [Candidatus Cloacimonetes bacterium]|nr:T9SS type A sorting domain-containing protein [Candidatus Cloacimonadota bacterium]MDY0228879.1 T9SS type A sorting domain-containing protein [Candidatus Cloacimonadaceae bacterium]
MQKRYWLILPFIFGLLYAIQCVSADGRVIADSSREYHYHYHSESNDLNFFGANRWAVRFNLRNAYPGLSAVNFRAQGARLWFPFPGGTVGVELRADAAGDPADLLTSQSIDVTGNQIDITFESEHIAETFWLMVDYSTNSSNRFVAASVGGGTHSYFMNQVGNIQQLSSFATAGYACELLFGLLGEFSLGETDLQLCDFDLDGVLLPAGQVKPAFRIYNHSDNIVSNANLRLILSRPGFSQYDTLNVAIPQSLAPRDFYEHLASSDLLIDLPDEPTQLRIEAVLSSEFAENDTLLANNKIVGNYQVFSDESPVDLIENFMREDESTVIHSIQEPYLSDTLHTLNYYPILSDPLANLPSMQRFNWYGFNSVPRTVVEGAQRIVGFTDQYESKLIDALTEASSYRSFITSSSCSLQAVENSENVSVTLEFTNDNTHLYTGVGQSLMSASRIFAGLFHQHDFDGHQGYVLSRWIAFADTVSSSLNMGSTISKSYSFTASGLFDDEDEDAYRLYYWVQQEQGGRIYYADFSDFDAQILVSNEDDLFSPALFRVYPNPLRGQNSLKISLAAPARLSIYNLRGQRLYSRDSCPRSLELPASLFPSSGLYFLRLEEPGHGTNTRKISIIK